ncbi:MAG: hypothetical protein ACK4FY_01975 [Aquificaceae bacterium]
MDMVDYSLKEEELKEIVGRLESFRSSLFLDLVVLMDDGGRLVGYSPYVDTHKTIAYRVALVGAATVGALDQLESIVSSKRHMLFAGVEKNMYIHVLNPKFLLASVFSHKVPLGSVKLFKERLSKDLAGILDKALSRAEKRVIRFEDIAL